jgi:hypothetical protein
LTSKLARFGRTLKAEDRAGLAELSGGLSISEIVDGGFASLAAEIVEDLLDRWKNLP